jgi:hypothetical protein
VWRRGLPHADPPTAIVVSRAGVYALLRRALVVGVALLPAVLLALPALRGWRPSPPRLLAPAMTAGGGLVLGARLLTGRPEPLLPGNYVGHPVPYAEAGIGIPAPVLPAAARTALVVAGALAPPSSPCPAAGKTDDARSRMGLLALFAVLYGGGVAAQTMAGQRSSTATPSPSSRCSLGWCCGGSRRPRASPSSPPARRRWCWPWPTSP